MRVMITGANGFVGRLLVQRLLETGQLRGQRIEALLLLDRELTDLSDDCRLRRHIGNLCDPALLRRALADGVDMVFHLASLPGGAAETDYEMGYQVNLQASLELLQQLRQRERPPVLVYASSIAVYGSELPRRMDESHPPRPQLSYATHKLMIETAVQDLTRLGLIDGRSVRLPGIVARPRQANGLRSAFMSDVLHAFAHGGSYTCPVSPQATAWWMSARCCVDNLLHAAQLTVQDGARVWQLPVLHLSIGQVLDALSACYGAECGARIRFEPDPSLEALFGRFPPLHTPIARALGFRHDGSVAALLRNALDIPSRRRVTLLPRNRSA
ncbi:NAD-dependent epimerase/dehydratase family protein [Pseudomonas syringae]|nr:NAD-dependent epimerase/dehydratase family protein [Pseudomonas syringae]MBD8790500.1 NAD-dependent epimerase/dehydratase family protein [Pseudomonas syringae]MBD8798738.1 NAD-dependent epimerase/dehydratase family protein [Pseudomonas syringae]MBD8809564.1 NAD-dependent epimerase/dehydratase family protein [Pseudomonas syringae]